MRWLPRYLCSCPIVAGSLLVGAGYAAAAEPLAANTTNQSAERTANYRPVTPAPRDASGHNPLLPVLQYARQEQAYLRQAVQDFSCRLVKRERIDGILQDYQHIDMYVREEVRESNRVVRPLSIFMKFIGPASVAGRRVLYIEGENDGKMLVRNGGRHFDYVVAQVDPNGRAAQAESLVPITETGLNRVLHHMIEVLEKHVQADPTGANTKVERLEGAKINKRLCSVVHIVHPDRQSGLEFHVANVFIDVELHVPVRVDFSDWPKRAGQTPPLLAEYTYTDLKLNVGLPNTTFDTSHLRSNR